MAVVALAALAAVYRSDDNDYWFHLAAGRSISERGLPSTESWALAARGEAPWLSEWLFHTALYQVHRLAGDWGVALWRASWTALAMVLAVRLLHRVGGASWTAVQLAPLAIAVARERFQPRPEQLFVALALFALVRLEEARRGGKDRTRWLVPAQVLWANVQGSWVFGPAIAWVYAAAAGIERRFGPLAGGAEPAEARSTRPAWPWVVLGLALWAASAIVPMPLQTLARPLRFLVDYGVDPLTGSIQELRPWSWGADKGDPFTVLLLLWLAGLLVGGQRIWRASPALLLVSLGAFGLALLGVRFRGLAAWLGLAPLALALAPAGGRLTRLLWTTPVVAAGIAGLFWLATAPQFAVGIRPHLYSVPVRAVAVAESLGLDGLMLNTFHHGGYLLWARGERHPPLIDGRGRGSLVFRSLFARAQSDPVALDSLLEAWDFDYILLEPPQSSEERLVVQLSRRLEWARIFHDDAGVLWVRWSRHPEIAGRLAYRYYTPDFLEMTHLSERSLTDPGLAERLVAELERARAESPWHARASMWLGLLALGRKDARTAIRYLDDAERIAPATPGLALRQGFAREMVGDLEGARRAYRRARRDPDDRTVAEASLRGLR